MTDSHEHAHDHAHEGLDVQVERTGPCLATVSFTVSPQEFEKTWQRGLKNVSRNTRMKGFRPGKTPRKVIEKQFGKQVELEAKKHFLNHAYDQAVKSEELRPASYPNVDLADIERNAEGGITHEFEVLLRPEVELGEYKGIQVQAESLDVADEQVEAALEEFRRQQSRSERTEGGLEKDGMAVCKVSFLAEGRDEPLLEREGIRMSPTTVPTGIDPEAFEKAMTGAKEGDSVDVEIEFPEDFPDETVRGDRGICRLTLNEVYQIIAATDEEIFKAFGVEDTTALDATVRKRMEEERAQQEENRIENAILDQVLANHPIEIAEPLVEEQARSKVAALREELEGQGLDPEQLEARLQEEYRRAFDAAHRAMRAIYVMEEIAKVESLQVEEEDLRAEMREIASRNEVELDEVRKYYQEQGLTQQLALELLERKVRSFLRESADIKEAG